MQLTTYAMVSVFKYIFKINFIALLQKGLREVLSLRMSLQLRSDWTCIRLRTAPIHAKP